MYDKTTPFQSLRDTVVPLRVAIPLVLFSTVLMVGLISVVYFSHFVLGQAAVMTVVLFCTAGLIGLYLHFVVTRRIERLVEVSQALGQSSASSGEDITEQRRAGQTLRESEQRFRAVFEQAAVGVARVAPDGSWLEVNQRVCDIVGYTKAEMLARTFQDITHPADLDVDLEFVRQMLAGEIQTYEMDKRYIRKNGSIVWIHLTVSLVREPSGAPKYFVSVIEDIDERKQAEGLLSGEKAILEIMAKDKPLSAILETIARNIEALSDDSLCSVLLLDDDGVHIRHGAAPSLTQEYNNAIDGVVIGPKVCSCGTAMYRNEQVIVTDIATDPLWDDYRGLALAHGLHACWSMPIQSATGRVLGSFALYWREPRKPTPADLALVAHMAHLSSIAIERNRAAAALLDSERKMRLVLDSLGPSLFVGLMTSDGVLIEANQPVLAAAGLTADEVLGKPFEETYCWAYSEPVQAQLRTAITQAQQGESSRYDVLIRIAEGVLIWIDFSLTPIHDAQGRVMYIVPSASVIDERKKAERKLAESEALWRTVIYSEPACVKLIDAQGRLIEMNPAGLAMIESESRDQVIGRDMKWLVAPDHRDAFERLYYRVMAGESGSLVFDIIGIKGTPRTLETHAAPLRDASGTVIALLGVTHDVTDRQRTARKLKESEARYRAIFEGAGVSLWEKDFSALQAEVMRLRNEHGEGLSDWFDEHQDELLALMRRVSVVDVNRASLDLFGAKTKDELIDGQSRIFVPESLPLFRDELLALARGARGFTAEAEVGTLNNAHLTVLVTFTAVEMARPWERILVSMLDVTEIKQYRVQLEALVTQRTAQLQSAYKELESFSYSISHDLRAPLRSISGFGQALQEEYGSQLDEAAQNYISRIQRGALRMGELIDALLRLSRVTRLDIHSKPLDLSKMANQIVESLRYGEPQRSVDVNITPGLMAVGDETLIYTVLENLLNNAWKYSSRIEHARIDFRQEQCDTERVFCVADNGAGFDMKYATMLFSPFQRMHTTAEFPGTGIGLATVERIIRRHGGRIWVEAEVDRGAQFYFTLPPKESTSTAA